MGPAKTAIVLGGYGLIGAACLRALKADGFTVIGVGRSLISGRRCDPDIQWLERDISRVSAEQWAVDLADIDVIVNASGALQASARDNLVAIHETAITKLTIALAGSDARFIQISAAGVSPTATTEFLQSKSWGDRILMDSSLDWTILRPTLVIGPQAYGGTALLRASAAFPVIGLKVFPESPMQTVFVDDVANAVVQAARGEIKSQTVADLTAPETLTLEGLTKTIRAWQGFPPWRAMLSVPDPLVRWIKRGADALGWLRWRSPLRTTALRVLEDGVTGDPQMWASVGGRPCRSLADTLSAMPATLQERWFARLYLLLPVAIATLALFWTLSGLIGFAGRQEAQALLTDRGMPESFAVFAVITGSIADIALGLAILFRPWARGACFGMIGVSIAYLIGGTLWAPDIWADPLGPFVKVLPGIALCLVVAAILEER